MLTLASQQPARRARTSGPHRHRSIERRARPRIARL